MLVAWCIVAVSFSFGALRALAAAEARRLERTSGPLQGGWPALTVLRPCEGPEEGLEENLLSSVTAAYGGAREVRLLVPSEADPAHAVATAVARTCAKCGVPVEVVVTAISTAGNRKVAQLGAGLRGARGTVVVIADSDVRFDDETLPSLVGALKRDARAGMSSAAYREGAADTLGDRASSAVLSSTPHAFHCLNALQDRAGAAHVPAGGLLALDRTLLDELGGFASLEGFLGEDFELARRLHARGHTIPIADAPAHITERGRRFGQVVRRYARWCMVTRQQRPLLFPTYFLLFACTPVQLAWGAGVAASLEPLGFAAAGVAVMATGARLALARALRRIHAFDTSLVASLRALLLGELTILAAATLALGPPIVVWRGRRYRIGRGGTLSRLE